MNWDVLCIKNILDVAIYSMVAILVEGDVSYSVMEHTGVR